MRANRLHGEHGLDAAESRPVWTSTTLDDPIRFEDLDATIESLALDQGMDLDARIPFVVEGTFEDLRWHVIDGSRLVAGGKSNADHQAASVQLRRDRVEGSLVGFFSEHDQGVFTHMGSETHVHCVLEDPIASGHVDHVVIAAGARVRFPVVAPPEGGW